MEEILKEIIIKIKAIEDDKYYSNFDDYFLAGIHEGVSKALEIIKEYLNESCGCDFCNDLRNIEPASYISSEDEEVQKFLNKAKEKKQFIYHYHTNEEEIVLTIVDECPMCGRKFTEEDYDNYD